MSQEYAERTKLGPGFNVYGVGTEENIVYPDDQDMEDTASSPVHVVGETVPETDVPSLGLTPQDSLSAESLRDVTGPRTAATRNPGDAGSVSTENLARDAHVAETTASGSQPPSDGQHHHEAATTSVRERSKSPRGREISPRTRTARLRARFAKLREYPMVRYLPASAPPSFPAPAAVPRDTVTREEANVVLSEIQKQIGDAA